MIRLTLVDGKCAYINPEHIALVMGCKHGQGSSVELINNSQTLHHESPEEVARKVLEYRLTMEEYKLLKLFDGDYKSLVDNLYKLAGLEEQKDE